MNNKTPAELYAEGWRFATAYNSFGRSIVWGVWAFQGEHEQPVATFREEHRAKDFAAELNALDPLYAEAMATIS